MPVYPFVCSFSCSEPLYLRDLINASCHLSPRWGFGECVFGVSIHLWDLYCTRYSLV